MNLISKKNQKRKKSKVSEAQLANLAKAREQLRINREKKVTSSKEISMTVNEELRLSQEANRRRSRTCDCCGKDIKHLHHF